MGHGGTSAEILGNGVEVEVKTGWKVTCRVDGRIHCPRQRCMAELDTTKEQLENLSKRYEELEAKSKADIKVLVNEVKSLRSSQKELKQEHSQLLNVKSETEVFCESA